MPDPSRIFHILDADRWQPDAPEYDGDTLASEGFIHCSNLDQVLGVANAKFQGREGLVLLEIDPTLVTSPIVYENLEGGEELYPHVYGPLPRRAVATVHSLTSDDQGQFVLPNTLT